MVLEAMREMDRAKKDGEKPTGLTLEEITKDPNRSELLGRMLVNEGGTEGLALAQKLFKQRMTPELQAQLEEASGKLSASERTVYDRVMRDAESGDIVKIDRYREEFSRRIAKVEELSKFMTPAMMKDLGRDSETFNAIMNTRNPEVIKQIIFQHMERLSVDDKARFANLELTLKNHETFKKGEYAETDKQVKEMLEAQGITEREYEKALKEAGDDEDKRRELLLGLVKGRMGIFASIINRRGIIEKSRLAELEFARETGINAVRELNARIRDIGNILGMTLDKDPSVRRAILAGITGESQDPEQFATFENAAQTLPELKRDQVETDFQAFKDQRLKENADVNARLKSEDGITYDELDPSVKGVVWDEYLDDAQREAVRSDFRKQQVAKVRQQQGIRPGFWVGIGNILLETALKSFDLK